MIEVKFDSQWISRNFYFIEIVGEDARKFVTLQLIPNNNELLKYYDKIKYYGTDSVNFKECLKFKNALNTEHIIKNDIINPNEYIIFQFDNEEDALYFKLKYC